MKKIAFQKVLYLEWPNKLKKTDHSPKFLFKEVDICVYEKKATLLRKAIGKSIVQSILMLAKTVISLSIKKIMKRNMARYRQEKLFTIKMVTN